MIKITKKESTSILKKCPSEIFANLNFVFEILSDDLNIKQKRIIADHLRSVAFLLADNVLPSNKDQGYVLRRLLRRVLVIENQFKLSPQIFEDILLVVIKEYGLFYAELLENKNLIINEYFKEREKFKKTLEQGLRELKKISAIDADSAFKLYESYGLPYEVIKDFGDEKAANLTRAGFDLKFEEHQIKSRQGAEKKFGGHGLLLDTGELKAANEEELKRVTRLHTATHLLQSALRKVLGNTVQQAGSDITAERLRFDFTFERKLTKEEIKKVEDLVNEVVKKDLNVQFEEMALEDAKKSGALFFFKEKYPEKVKVYSVGDFSKEFCGGPHVKNTSEIGNFKITKEESVASGIRRIRAILE